MATKKSKRRNYTSTFKKQIVQLYQNGESEWDIAKEYDIYESAINEFEKCTGTLIKLIENKIEERDKGESKDVSED